MNIAQFITSLIPSVKKADVKEDIRITQKEISEKAIPLYSDANTYFQSTGFKSPESKEISNRFLKAFRFSDIQGKNVIECVNKALPMLVSVISQIDSDVDELLSTTNMTDVLTYKKASLIRGADLISFASLYSLNLLTYIYINEVIEVGGSEYKESKMPKAKEMAVVNNIDNFAKILTVYAVPLAKYNDKFKDTPDINISMDADVVTEALKGKNPDMLNVSLPMGFYGNPIYSFGMIIAEWQANRYKANKERKAYLELKLLQLKSLRDGSDDHDLDKQIQYMEDRIAKLDYKIHKQEESVK